MSGTMKPNPKSQHAYAIVRYDLYLEEVAPIDRRITVKKVVADPDYADKEVERLNALNKGKGSYYFRTITRLEGVPIEVRAVPPGQLAAAEEPRG
jgi:hypothetical protein